MGELSLASLSEDIQAAIAELKQRPDAEKVGIVTRIGDGIAWVYGLGGCGFSEMLEIAGSDGNFVTAVALSLGEGEIGTVLLGDDTNIAAGARVRLTGKVLEVPVGPELLGRVVDPLGRPLDGGKPIETKQMGRVERVAPSVLDRQTVSEPMLTGLMSIDAIVPIGRGQRELIIGDRQTGKTAIAIDAIVNQARQKTGVISIYVAVGQKRAKIAALIERLRREHALERTIIVATSPADPAALLYLAPYAGAAIGEYFRDNKQHALIVYDDLSKHAVAYRQMSLLLRRPPGREAYPGDVFYLHSRLLERAAKLSDELGGGSLTALPIVETQAGDISAYIPTNIISITDGQIFLAGDLFYQGIRPAISVGLSVSRVGGNAQTKVIKSVAGGLKLGLAQFRELASFAQFSTDLDAETKHTIERGQRLTEILKQPQYSPLASWQVYVLLSAANDGAFDAVPLELITTMKATLLREAKSRHPTLIATVNAGDVPTKEQVSSLLTTAKHVAASYTSAAEPAPEVRHG